MHHCVTCTHKYANAPSTRIYEYVSTCLADCSSTVLNLGKNAQSETRHWTETRAQIHTPTILILLKEFLNSSTEFGDQVAPEAVRT
jgi:hypothetical protein